MKRRAALGCLTLALMVGCAAPRRPDPLTELLALNVQLLSHDSATLTLEHWCGEHHLADPPRVVAHRDNASVKPIPDELRTRLQVTADEPIAYRHVQLVCGEHVLSEADNWYVPRRLTPEMNRRLETSDEPFGKVVAALGFKRRAVAADVLWRPAAHERTPPREVLRHRAVLYSSAYVPFSAVVETYQSGLLEFGREH